MTDLPARVSRRNVFLLLVDYCTFGVGMTFLGVTTVLPSLVRLLGGGPVVVGSLGAIQSGGWLLPQLLAGRYVAGRPLVKRFIVIPAGVGRGLLALFPGVLMLFAGRAPAVALAVLLAVSTCFWVADALASVAWFDLVAKAIPAERRGRVMGAGGSIGGLLGIGAGWAVTGILARPDPFPSSYALLIVLASACFGVGLASMAAIHEPRGAGRGEAQAGWRDYIPRLGLILRTDARFVWLTLTRWLGGFADMAAAFYVLFATDRLGVPQQEIGLFLSAGVAGSLLSGVLLGPLRDRKGSACIVTATLALRCFCPAAALLAPLVAGGRPQAAVGILVLIYAAMGMANGSHMIGFMNYLLEIAPPAERSTYMGLGNTLSGVLMLAPFLAGWIVRLASYQVLFAVALGFGILGLATAVAGPQRIAAWRAARPRAAGSVRGT